MVRKVAGRSPKQPQEPTPEKPADDDGSGWGSFGSTKKDKKKGKNTIEEVKGPGLEPLPTSTLIPTLTSVAAAASPPVQIPPAEQKLRSHASVESTRFFSEYEGPPTIPTPTTPFIPPTGYVVPLDTPSQLMPVSHDPSSPNPMNGERIGSAPPQASETQQARRTVRQTSSYWSVSEQNNFPGLLRHFGTDWHAIAKHMQSKTHIMVRNYYQRQVDWGKAILEDIAREADEKRERGEYPFSWDTTMSKEDKKNGKEDPPKTIEPEPEFESESEENLGQGVSDWKWEISKKNKKKTLKTKDPEPAIDQVIDSAENDEGMNLGQKGRISKDLVELNSEDPGLDSSSPLPAVSEDAQKTDIEKVPAKLRTSMNEAPKKRSKWASNENVGQEELYESMEKVLSELKAMTQHSVPFLTRVNKRQAPDYYNFIKNPMDFGTMTKKLKELRYKSKAEFVADLDLIWNNCLKYNSDMSHPLRSNAISLRREAERLIPLIPNIIVGPRAEVEAEERRMHISRGNESDDESDDEPIMSSRGRFVPFSEGAAHVASGLYNDSNIDSAPINVSGDVQYPLFPPKDEIVAPKKLEEQPPLFPEEELGRQDSQTEDASPTPDQRGFQTEDISHRHVAPATDSGYASATHEKSAHAQNLRIEDEQNQQHSELDDTRTVYSDALSLPVSRYDNYISELADDLINKIQSVQQSQNLGRISKILPELLKAFALKIGHDAPTQMHRDVMFFVHRNRIQIARSFEDKYFHKEEVLSTIENKDSDIMPLNDIMNNWYQSLEDPIDEEPPGSEASVDDLMDLDSYEDGEANMPELLAYQNFIFQSPAYEWLLANLRREFFLTSPEPNYMEIIGKKIIQCLPSSHVVSRKRSAESYEITFEIEWSPLAFVSEQMYKEELGEAIENAITLTGSTNDAQALTCAQYLCQTWPLSGEYTIKLIKDVVRSGAGHQHTCVIPDNTKLTAWMQGSKFIVGAFGTGAAISEIGEQLAWLGAALRSSPYETGVTWSIPFIDDIIIKNVSRQVSGISDPPIIICKIGFNVEKQGFFQLSNGQCWHNLFRNPVVVKGYPIPRRSETDAGLEIPLNLMAGLTGARRVNSFNGKLFIKGFSSMLIPTKRNRDILVWHLLYNQDGARISYLETTVPHAENINISNLESARHILGWCSEVKYCAGAVDANYAIKPSRLPRSYVGCSLDDVLIHKGQIITGGFPFAIGHKDVPVHITRNGYIPKLKWIHTKFVVFWDEEDKRGWLVNGTSALLHLLRASLEYDSTDEFSFEFCFKREDMQEAPEMHKAYSAVKVLQNKQNLKLKIYPEKEDFLHLEGRVEELYDTLEKTIDHQVSIAGQYDIRPRKYLEGWDFNDMARCRDLIYPRVTTLHTAGKGWVDFTRSLHAITLFGRGFGEIIKPVNTTSCHRWTKLPKGEHYLAASVYDLKRIMEMDGDQEANPMKLNHNIIWHTTDKIFEPCQCIGKEKEEHSDLVQVLLPSTFNNIQSKKSHVQLEDFGAVIFGHSNNFKWFWKDTGSPEHGELPHEGLNIESHDSGLGSDLSSSVVEGSRAYSQQLSSETLSTDTFIPENYTVGVVCALQKELMAVRLLFDRRHPDLKLPLQDTNHYALGRIEQHNVVAACLPSGEYGTNSAAVVVSHMVRSFPAVKFCLLVGIGGGVPSKQNDIRLGDVIVSLPTDTHTGVIQYDLGKALGNSVFERTGSLQRPPHFLMTAISSLMSDPDFSPKQLRRYVEDISTSKPEYKYPGVKHDKLFVSDYVHNPDYETCGPCNGKRITRKNRSGNHPNIHYGLIASGNQVIKDAKTRDLLGAKYRMLCFEMEAAGVLNTIPCLVIRGICDYSDSHKNKLWQEYAAATAAAYTKMLLSVVRNLNDLEIMPTDSETIRSAKRPASSQLARSAMGKKRRDLSLS